MDHKSTKTAPCKSVLGDYRLDDSQVESSRSERQISDTFPELSHSPFPRASPPLTSLTSLPFPSSSPSWVVPPFVLISLETTATPFAQDKCINKFKCFEFGIGFAASADGRGGRHRGRRSYPLDLRVLDGKICLHKHAIKPTRTCINTNTNILTHTLNRAGVSPFDFAKYLLELFRCLSVDYQDI